MTLICLIVAIHLILDLVRSKQLASPQQVTLFCSDIVQRVDVWSGMRVEEMSPQATLKHHAQVFTSPFSFCISHWYGGATFIRESIFLLVTVFTCILPPAFQEGRNAFIIHPAFLSVRLFILTKHQKIVFACHQNN